MESGQCGVEYFKLVYDSKILMVSMAARPHLYDSFILLKHTHCPFPVISASFSIAFSHICSVSFNAVAKYLLT